MLKFYFHARKFISLHLTPARMFVISFAVFILAGALCLWFPFSASGNKLRFVDALFTATSAVCVTGLSPLDIGKELSLTGQLITMFLFQVGGLGIITFSVIFFSLMGRGISFKGREIAQSTFLHTPRHDFYAILKKVMLYTFIVEAAGAVILFLRFMQDFPAGKALYAAVFHAVSAFNNAGFSLFPDSLMSYRNDITVNFAVMALIILGGIGFIVQYEVISRLRGIEKHLSVHTKIVLITTAVLIVAGAVFFYFLENNNVLKGAGLKTVLLSSFFQSVTSRTAGFNTVDIGALTNPTILTIMILMFIGASPGSTGGGVKTTSFSLLLLFIFNRLRGNANVNVGNRTIPEELIEKTIYIIFASAFCICVITSVLLLFSGDTPSIMASRSQFVEYLFETISAFGTVGLSMNLTPKLNDVQKYAIIFMMFAGRVGPLTLAFAWYSSRKKGLTYAEESVMVG